MTLDLEQAQKTLHGILDNGRMFPSDQRHDLEQVSALVDRLVLARKRLIDGDYDMDATMDDITYALGLEDLAEMTEDESNGKP